MTDQYKNENEFEYENDFEIDEPKRYKVLLLNDDYTTMEFVVEILMQIFHKTQKTALQIMLDIHEKGQGICGVYNYEIAATKVNQVLSTAKENKFPLRANLEEE